MTDLAAALLKDVPRHAPDGVWMHEEDVLAALSRALDPALTERAGEVLEGVTPGKWRQHLVDETTVVSPDGSQVCCTFPNGGTDDDADYEANWETHEANARFIAWARNNVPALLTQNAALRAERDAVVTARDTMGNLWAQEKARAEAAEAEVEKLRGALQIARVHVANNAEGWSVSRGAARDDLTIVDAAITEATQ